jgi:hypothetical protein
VTLLSVVGALSDLWSSRCDYCTLKGFDCGEKQSEFGHMKTRRDQHRTDDPAPYRMKPLPLVVEKHTPHPSGGDTRVDFTPRGSVFRRHYEYDIDGRRGNQFHHIYHPERLDTCAVWLQETKVLFEDTAANERLNRKAAIDIKANSVRVKSSRDILAANTMYPPAPPL